MGPAVTLEKSATRCTTVPINMIRLSRSGGGGAGDPNTSPPFHQDISILNHKNQIDAANIATDTSTSCMSTTITEEKAKIVNNFNNDDSNLNKSTRIGPEDTQVSGFGSCLPIVSRGGASIEGSSDDIKINLARKFEVKNFIHSKEVSNYDNINSLNESSLISSIDNNIPREGEGDVKLQFFRNVGRKISSHSIVNVRNNEEDTSVRIKNVTDNVDSLRVDKMKLLNRIMMMTRRLNHLHKKQVKTNVDHYYKQLQQLLSKNNMLVNNKCSLKHSLASQRDNNDGCPTTSIQQQQLHKNNYNVHKNTYTTSGDNHQKLYNEADDDNDDEVLKLISNQIEIIKCEALKYVAAKNDDGGGGDDVEEEEETEESCCDEDDDGGGGGGGTGPSGRQWIVEERTNEEQRKKERMNEEQMKKDGVNEEGVRNPCSACFVSSAKNEWNRTLNDLHLIQQKITTISKVIREIKQTGKMHKIKRKQLEKCLDQSELTCARCQPMNLLLPKTAKITRATFCLQSPAPPLHDHVPASQLDIPSQGSPDRNVCLDPHRTSWMSTISRDDLVHWLAFHEDHKLSDVGSELGKWDDENEEEEDEEEEDNLEKSCNVCNKFSACPSKESTHHSSLIIRIKKSSLPGLVGSDILPSVDSPFIDENYDEDGDHGSEYYQAGSSSSSSSSSATFASDVKRRKKSKQNLNQTSLFNLQVHPTKANHPLNNNNYKLSSSNNYNKYRCNNNFKLSDNSRRKSCSYQQQQQEQQQQLPQKRHSTNSYDINDVYIPPNMSSCRLQLLTYKEIDVPKWRVLNEENHSKGESHSMKNFIIESSHQPLATTNHHDLESGNDGKQQTETYEYDGEEDGEIRIDGCDGQLSEEDTSDKAYMLRHLAFEIYEKKQRIPNGFYHSGIKSLGSVRKKKNAGNDDQRDNPEKFNEYGASFEKGSSIDYVEDHRHSTLSASSETFDCSSWAYESDNSIDHQVDGDVGMERDFYNNLWRPFTPKLDPENKEKKKRKKMRTLSVSDNFCRQSSRVSNATGHVLQSYITDDATSSRRGGLHSGDKTNPNPNIFLLGDDSLSNDNGGNNVTFFTGFRESDDDANENPLPLNSPSCSTASALSPFNLNDNL